MSDSETVDELLYQAVRLVGEGQPSLEDLNAMHQRLCEALSPQDLFLFRWRAKAEHKGWQG